MSREIWVADSETDPFKHGRIPKPFIWGLYNGSEYHEFTDTDKFVDFLSEIDGVVYAHNGGKFDWHFITHRFEVFEPLMIISGRIAKFKIGLCEFRDSYNILPIALAVWEKEKFDYSILEESERHKPGNWKKIQDYLKSDCVNLYDAVTAFARDYGTGLTLAGSAMKQWQKIADVKAPKTNEHFYNTIAPYYYGGRVECFEAGLIKEPFKVIDINSAYPFAMKHWHPYGEIQNVSNNLPNSRPYIERSFIRLSGISGGALPYRGKDGSLSFPCDNVIREYCVSGWEFLAAIETKSLTEWDILEVTTFQDSIRFDDYIDHFYKMKAEAEKGSPDYIFAKLFLNSLYGKFGANPEKYQEHMVVHPRHIDAASADGYGFCAELGKFAIVAKDLDIEKQRYYHVGVAASITGFVRAYMHRAMKQCKGVIYCDTDSIVCRDTGGLRLDPSELGAWDVESVASFGGFAGKKLYAILSDNGEWKTASKGVRLSAEEIIKVASGEEITYTPENPSFSIKRGIKFNSRKVVATA